MADTTTPGTGRITRIIGAVVDVEFPPDAIPAMYNALKVTVQATSAGEEPHEITLEVAQHLGDNIVRTISLKPTDGLVRGTQVRDTGAPISVPVGDVTKGHVFNVTGDVLNLGPGEQLEITERWPIHRQPPAFDQLESKTEMMVTGIKVIDLLTEDAAVLPSKGELRKLIASGGVSVNKEKVASPDDLITSAQLIADRYLLVQRGKKNYYLVLAK